MKYIKIYENKKYTIKNYVVWRIVSEKYTILKVIGGQKTSDDVYDNVELVRVYMYDLETDKEYHVKDDRIFNFSVGHALANVIFQSDIYKECLEYIEMKLTANKYNI